ncbi:hypothetical protein B0H67DRAFT_645814 [Lasiosphaeris hirsuta]|uniref:Uncharacterized protein n=1 Tax=Lasiosphaeris hirsuta TaxID=260670 RepID=A0AA40AHY0_9PEZI|nr:hypothetical protein B0H67DRAFT_645814 [Lasiosphaeris hirsuta]
MPTGPQLKILKTSIAVAHTLIDASLARPSKAAMGFTFLAVLSVCVIYFVRIYNVVGAGALTNTITSPPPKTSTSSVWLATSIAVATAILSPIVSQAATLFGHRWFLIMLTALGAAGSITIARAYGVQPLLHAVSSEVVPRRYRSWGQAADLIANALGGITALLVSGGFVRAADVAHDGWRNVWNVGTGSYGFAALSCALLYRPPPREEGGESVPLVGSAHVGQLSTLPELIAITPGLVIGVRSLWVDNALFTGAMSHVGDNIAAAILPLGLPPSSLGPFIEALTSHANESLFKIPGATPQVVGAGADTALLATISTGFKHFAVFIEDPSKEFNMHIDAPLEKEENLYSSRV